MEEEEEVPAIPRDEEDGLVLGEEPAVRAWLVEEGFEPGDLHSAKEMDDFYCTSKSTPLEWALEKGEVRVRKWLFDNGCLVPGEEPAVRAWLVEQGFKPGDLRSSKSIDGYRVCPMTHACLKGQLNVCKWLSDHGASKDVYKVGKYGQTPMLFACKNGDLLVCEWLFQAGADRHISRVYRGDGWGDGDTLMHKACEGGHLPVCEWLFKVGATELISKPNNAHNTPFQRAYHHQRLQVILWLVFTGALNGPTKPPEHSDASEEVDDEEDQGGHVNQAIVWRDTIPYGRRFLLKWANGVVKTHHTFLHVVLHSSVILPASQQHISPDERCRLPWLFRSDHLIMRRVGSFLGVEMGRRLRNAREFAEALEAIGEDPRESGVYLGSSFRGTGLEPVPVLRGRDLELELEQQQAAGRARQQRAQKP